MKCLKLTYQPHIAAYTYDAGGERGIRYVPRQQEGVSSGATSGYVQDMDIMLYPNALVTVRPQELTEEFNFREPPPEYTFTTYTKHYYIGSERISSKLGTRKDLGIMCEQLGLYPDLVDEMNRRVDEAGEQMNVLYSNLNKDLRLPTPHYYDDDFNLICFEPSHHPELYDAYWYHPDHLGSLSYITNTTGEISQHNLSRFLGMEYLPFGETLVEEHLNSYNSPFKFNGKEFDAETGNYYYGARYYSQKYNLMLSVDPASELYPGVSPYIFAVQNPVRFIDPTGMVVEDGGQDPPVYDGGTLATVYLSNKKDRTWSSESSEYAYLGSPSDYQSEYPEYTGMSDASMLFKYRSEHGYSYEEWSRQSAGAARVAELINLIKFATYDTGILDYSLDLMGPSAGAKVSGLGLSSSRTFLSGYKVGEGAVKKMTVNPFKGKTFSQIDEMFKAKGFTTKGVDPLSGKGSYFSPSGTRYYFDKGGMYKKGFEGPHIDIWYKEHPSFEKVKYFLDGSPKMYTPLK